MTQRFDILDRLRILARFRWAIVICILGGIIGGYGWSSRQTKLYRATAILLARNMSSQTDVFSTQQNIPTADVQNRNVATQIKILESPPVKAAVVAKLPNAPDVLGSQVGQTNEFTAEVTSHNPGLASLAATAYAQTYIDFQRDQSVIDITAAAASVTTGVHVLQVQLDDIQSQIDQRIAAATANHIAPQTDPATIVLQQQHQSVVQQLSVFQTKLSELNVNAQLKQSPAVLVSPAKTPRAPYSPRPARSAVLAAMMALLLAIALAFVIDYLDDRIKSRSDVEAATEGLAVLGTLPRVTRLKSGSTVNVVNLGPTSGAAEAFRSLRTNVQFLTVEEKVSSLLVTSPSMGEGKTTVVGNLAIALGRSGQSVVLLDADMRKPRLHHFFGFDGSLGLSSILSGSTTLADVIQEVPGEPNLRLVTAGPLPPNPSELLGSERARQLIEVLRDQCDILIIDTPPIIPVTDAVALSSRVDACILVARSGSSKKRQLHRAIQSLRQVNARLMGVVVNDVEVGFGDGYGYGYGHRYGHRYGYGYGGTKADRKRPWRRRRRKPELVVAGASQELIVDPADASSDPASILAVPVSKSSPNGPVSSEVSS